VGVDDRQPDPETAPSANVYTVSPGHFQVMDIPLLSGRALLPADDERAPRVVVISKGLARRIAPDGDVLGRHASVPVLQPVRRALVALDPSLSLGDAASIEDLVGRQTFSRRGLTTLLAAFAALALGLAALGLYASLAYTVLQRRAELAVPIALGARAGAVLRLVLSEGVLTTAVGRALGVAGSLALGRPLEHEIFGIESRDPVTLILICVVLAAVAVGASAVPGLRAVRTDPALTRCVSRATAAAPRPSHLLAGALEGGVTAGTRS
jgi:FtsX-like permease family/MacB-like periplasmic core domain